MYQVFSLMNVYMMNIHVMLSVVQDDKHMITVCAWYVNLVHKICHNIKQLKSMEQC